MAVKTFTSGEQLTASDTNTYLANPGLVQITPSSVTNGTLSGAQVTVGNAVASITINGAFNSTYTNYRIVLSGIVCSAGDTTMFVRPGGDTTASSYFSGGYFVQFTGAGVGYIPGGANTDGIAVGLTSTTDTSLAFDIFNPNVAKWTRAMGGSTGDSYISQYGGVHKVTTAYTSLVIRPNTGTMSGGNINVYGYRVG